MRLASLTALALLCTTSLATADRGRHRRHRDYEPVPPATSAGAIASSPSTGQVGWAYGYGSQIDARYAAQQSCGQWDCAWVVSEENGAAALVLGANGHYVGWDTAIAGAQQRALEACSASTTGCRVVRWVTR